MGTILERTRKDGSKAFTAQIVIKNDGAIAHREAQTFDRKQAAKCLDRETRSRAQASWRTRAEGIHPSQP